MKKVVLIASLGLMAIGFNACKKDDVLKSTSNIPTYSSFEEVDSKLEKLESMSEDERREYERSNGFKSLLTKTYEIYEKMDVTKNKDVQDVRAFVALYPNFIELRSLDEGFVSKDGSFEDEDEDNEEGDFECYPLFSEHLYSPLADETRMFIVGEVCYKIFEDGEAATSIENIDLLRAINDVYGKNLSWDDRIIFSEYEEFEIEMKSTICHPTRNERSVTRGRNRTKLKFVASRSVRDIKTHNNVIVDIAYRVQAYGRIRPYMRTLRVWYHARRTISGRVNFIVTYRLNDGTNQTLSRDVSWNSGTVYSRTASASRNHGFGVIPSNIRFTMINSWGSTPSTSQSGIVEIDCTRD